MVLANLLDDKVLQSELEDCHFTAAALSDLHGAWTAMDGSKRQVSKRTKGLGQFWSEKRCHLSHSDLPFEDVERPSFIQFKQAKAKQVTHGSQNFKHLQVPKWWQEAIKIWDQMLILGRSGHVRHVWWVNLVSAKGMRNPTQTLSWCAVQISFLHIYLWKEQRRLFSPRQLLHGSASLQGKLLIWNCLIFRSLKPTCQFWQSYYIIFDILLQLDSLVCQNVRSQENTLAQDLYVAAEGKMAMVCPCLLALSQWTRASGCKDWYWQAIMFKALHKDFMLLFDYA